MAKTPTQRDHQVAADHQEPIMSRTTLIAAAFATLFLTAPAFAADTAAFQCPAKGTVIETTNGDMIEYMGAASASDDTTCKHRFNRRPQATLFGGLWDANGNYVSNARDEISSLFPLKAGSRTSTTMTSPTSGTTYHVIFEVRQEKITIAAGTFDTFVIDHTEKSLSGNTELKWTSWYATSVNVIVKQQFAQIRGNFIGPSAPIQSYEAESITLPAAQPVAQASAVSQ
jgi:hypothetical protein